MVCSALAIINRLNLHTSQESVNTAFLNERGNLYEGFQGRCFQENKLCRFKRSFYDLKEGPKLWNLRFRKVAKRLELHNYLNESCLFTSKKQRILIMVEYYVDDLLITSNDEAQLNEIKEKLS